MDLGIDGHAALVTASSSGLGKASASALADAGADVVLNGRDRDRLRSAVADVDDVGDGRVVGHQGDLTEPDDIESLVERTTEEFGRLDHVVTSSGGPPPLTPLETADEDWYRAFDLLVMSVMRLVRAAAEPLQAGDGGTLVTITSRSVKEPVEWNALSSCVRMPVIGLTKIISRELAPAVRANAVLPGEHDTPRIQEYYEKAIDRGEFDSMAEAYAERSSDIPAGRLGEPGELGRTVAFLSSNAGGFINGESIVIDGGKVRTCW